MKLQHVLFVLVFTSTVCLAKSDHFIINSFPGAKISSHKFVEYDEIRVLTSVPSVSASGDLQVETKPVAGKVTYIYYKGPEGKSPLQVFRNYQKVIKKQGMDVLMNCERPCTKKNLEDFKPLMGIEHLDVYLNGNTQNQILTAKKGNIYLTIFVNAVGGEPFPSIWQFVIEEETLDDDLISPIAAELAGGGKVDLYGFYFDSGAATLQSQSQSELEKVSELLGPYPNLRLKIIGHTDSVGSTDANNALSLARANAVKQALVERFGISEQRLQTAGKGEQVPIASNDTSEGRKINRRVELVAINPEALRATVPTAASPQPPQMGKSQPDRVQADKEESADLTTAIDKTEEAIEQVDRVKKLKDKLKGWL